MMVNINLNDDRCANIKIQLIRGASIKIVIEAQVSEW